MFVCIFFAIDNESRAKYLYKLAAPAALASVCAEPRMQGNNMDMRRSHLSETTI